MANIQLEDISERMRLAVKLIAEFGGFGDDYSAVVNSNFKNENFLYDLNHFIEGKKYKTILAVIKDEYPIVLDNDEMIADDEKILRRSLRSLGFNDEDFYNPKRENELSEPTGVQKILYYKEKGMLDVHLFNKMAFMDSEFDPKKCEISKKDSSVTQGSHTLIYDGKEIITFDAGKELIDGEWQGISNEERMKTFEKLYYEGNEQFTGTLPICEKYGLQEKLDFLEAVKGIDVESNNKEVHEVAYAAQKGFVDMNSHYNLLAMLSHDTKAPVVHPSAQLATSEILDIEKLAIRKLKNDDLVSSLQRDINEIRDLVKETNPLEYSVLINKNTPLKELKDFSDDGESETFDGLVFNIMAEYDLHADPTNEKKLEGLKEDLNHHGIKFSEPSLYKNPILTIPLKDRELQHKDVSSLYGSAHWELGGSSSEIFKKIDSFYDKADGYIMEREVLRLQRPDLEGLIKDAHLALDTSRDDMTIFRGGRLDDYDFGSIGFSARDIVSGDWAELSIANNGFRRELYLAPTESFPGGANFSYCEGDLSLVVPKDKDDFEKRLENGISFYIEDELSLLGDDKDRKANHLKDEMLEKLNIDKNSIGIDEAKSVIADAIKKDELNQSSGSNLKV